MFQHSIVACLFFFTSIAGDPIRTNSNTSLQSFESRIVGGKPTSIKDYPWQISMQVIGFHFCGGSIISKNVILTAAHCTIYATEQMSVRVGSSIRENGGIVHRVKQAVRHENYHTNTYGSPVNDLALLKLDSTIEFGDSARTVGLFNQDEEAVEGTLSTVTGWGTTIENGVEYPEVLHTADICIVSKSKCYEAYLEEFNGIPEGQICAVSPVGERDTCQGDSGGPLVIGGRQAGIVSWGNGCARKGFPGVYTEIAYFRNWIDIHV